MSKQVKVDARYVYGILEPVTSACNKHGQVIIGTHNKIFDYMERHPEEFQYSTFELVMPSLLMGFGFLLICLIIGLSF